MIIGDRHGKETIHIDGQVGSKVFNIPLQQVDVEVLNAP